MKYILLPQLLIIVITLFFFPKAIAQTSLYTKVGIGKTEIKKFETKNVHLGMHYNPGLFNQYEVGVIQDFSKGVSVKLGGGVANYSCVISSPKDVQPYIPDYKDTHVNLYYISVPVGVLYNPFLNLKVEVGLVCNFNIFLSQDGPSHTFQSIKEYNYFKKYNYIPYWGFSYTIFDIVEVGFIDHIYLSNFATYTNWYEQENGIEPSVFFKYNVWYVYASFKVKLSKRDE